MYVQNESNIFTKMDCVGIKVENERNDFKFCLKPNGFSLYESIWRRWAFTSDALSLNAVHPGTMEYNKTKHAIHESSGQIQRPNIWRLSYLSNACLSPQNDSFNTEQNVCIPIVVHLKGLGY